MCKLSIILPIYNVEKYLAQCIDSIKSQDGVEQCEMLLINDGSEDRSSEICEYYALHNSWINVYHKKNGGLSDARNLGLSKANGEYVLFIDSDDFINPNTLSIVLEKLNQNDVDILLMDAVTVDEFGNKMRNSGFEFVHKGLSSSVGYTGEQCIMMQLNSGVFQTTVWLGVYRRNFLISNQFWFKKGLLHEDELWSPITMLEAQKVIYEPIEFYSYRIRNNSIMRGQKKDNSKNIVCFIYVYSHITKYYDWKVTDKKLLKMLKDDVSRRYLHCISVWEVCNYPDLMKRIDKLEILRNSKSKKNKIRAILLLLNSKMYTKFSENFIKAKTKV